MMLILPGIGKAGSIAPIDKKIEARMRKGHSYKDSCPVTLKDLRYLRLRYLGFDGKDHTGEMIVHKDVAKNVILVFSDLYRIRYPIRKMRLVSDYGGSDWKSIEADNTSAFNCRRATGSNNWSKHSFGKAIDINPIENPYIRRNGHISHRASYRYKTRRHRDKSNPADRAMIVKGDLSLKIFLKYGWRWGAYFSEAKDLQHFSHP